MRANSYKVVLRLVIVSPVGTNKFDLYNCSHYLDKDGVQMENIVNKSEKQRKDTKQLEKQVNKASYEQRQYSNLSFLYANSNMQTNTDNQFQINPV